VRTGETVTADDLERQTVRAIAWRVVPLLLLGYLIAYIDRINVGFAAAALKTDFGISNGVLGFGAGLFYAGYFLFDVPSNLMLERIGARRWMARIMIGWGVLAAAMVLVRGMWSFYALRFLLGIGEAGFFPGVIFLIVLWFPARHQTRLMALFSAGIPLSSVIGGPLSSALLGLNGVLGVPGWQWLFLAEGIPAVLVGLALYLWLPDAPSQASWLTAAQKAWLAQTLAADPHRPKPARLGQTLRAFLDPDVAALAWGLFVNIAASVGLAIFLPQIVAGMGARGMMVGVLSAVPATAGLLGLYALGAGAARFGNRAMLACSLGVSAAGLALAAWFGGGASALGLAALSLAGFGIFGLKGPFWALTPTVFAGAAAAGGIAWINSIGNLGGWVGPTLVGWMSEHWGGFAGGLYGLAAAQFLGLLLVRKAPATPRRPG
jgi:ACS family tartrate transporter-like MFS transporter